MNSWAACLTEEPWAWQDDANVVVVMAHLLRVAAISTRLYRYETLARGDVLVSHSTLASVTGLTVKQVRLSLIKLKGVGELEAIRRPRGLILRLLRYEDWQVVRMESSCAVHQGTLAANVSETEVQVKKCRGNNERVVSAESGQSHNINKGGFLTNKSPLPPRTEVCAKKSPRKHTENHGFGREGFSSQNQNTDLASLAHPVVRANGAVISEEKARGPHTDHRHFPIPNPLVVDRERLQALASSERIFFSASILDRLCSEPLEYIGLVYEAAIEKRDGKSNVIFPHAVARYRADQGALPRKDTLERLRRVLNPPAVPTPRHLPRPNCPYCAGAGTVCGEPCECVGGTHRAADEINRLKQERDEAMRQIRQQLSGALS